ncbi:MAG TPA: hypothetical protein VK395_05565 [Gemmataceae bacterium]|nr:hypothetical protein [Gemmataceae bacterium]
MTSKQRRVVFANAIRLPPRATVNRNRLRQEIDEFRLDSLAGEHCTPFNVYFKNCMDVPKAEEEWCDCFARFVAEASRLTTSHRGNARRLSSALLSATSFSKPRLPQAKHVPKSLVL